MRSVLLIFGVYCCAYAVANEGVNILAAILGGLFLGLFVSSMERSR